MIKILIFIKKLPGISAGEFRDYYENHHAPLASRIFPMYALYRRNYIEDEVFGQPPALGYDVVTEIGFATRADFDRWKEIAAQPETLAAIRRDEANFLVSEATRIFFVGEFSSEPAPA